MYVVYIRNFRSGVECTTKEEALKLAQDLAIVNSGKTVKIVRVPLGVSDMYTVYKCKFEETYFSSLEN